MQDERAHAASATTAHDSAELAVRPERRDAAEHRQRILIAARTLFAEHGVEAVTMQQVGRAAGVGQGTLYRRFPHKGALCAALLRDRLSVLRRQVAAHTALDGPGDQPLDHLVQALALIAEFTEENAPLLRAMQDAGGTQGHTIFEGPLYAWLRVVFAAALQQATATGALPPLDGECLADTLLAALAPDAYLHRRHVLGQSRERIVAGLRELLLGLSRAASAE